MPDNHSARAIVKKAAENRTVEVIREERNRAQIAIDTARQRFKDLTQEMHAAMGREASAHPLLGKKVRRTVKEHYGQTRAQRGIVEQNTGKTPLYVGTGKYRVYAMPGEAYVRTLSGKGAHPITGEPWELDE